MALEIIYRPLADLVPYARNARLHNSGQIDQLKASLLEYGWTNPILTAELDMLAGHGRLTAAMALLADRKRIPGNPDPEMAPTIDLSHLSRDQQRTYVLADNKIAENSGWDKDLLKLEIGDIKAGGFDLCLTGFSSSDLDSLFSIGTPDHHQVKPSVTVLDTLIKVRCNSNDSGRVVAAIEAALKQAGIENTLVPRRSR